MKAKLLADDTIELDGSPEEITRVIVEAYARIKTVTAAETRSISPEVTISTDTKSELTMKKSDSWGFSGKGKKQAGMSQRSKLDRWTENDYEALITDIKNGRKRKDIAKTFGVSDATIYQKIKKLKKQGRLPEKGGNKTN